MTVWQRLFRRGGQRLSGAVAPEQWLEEHQHLAYDGHLDHAVNLLEDLLGVNDDLVIRSFRVFGQHPAVLVYFSNLVNREVINEQILWPLMQSQPSSENDRGRTRPHDAELTQRVMEEAIYYGEVHTEREYVKMVEALYRGEPLLLVAGASVGILLATRNVAQRSVEQPQTEQAIRGGRDGFTELLSTNITLLRYRLQTPNLRVKMVTIGRMTKTKIAVCYVEGIVQPALLKEVEDRLKAVDVDGIFDAGTLEQFIEDNHWSPFPQVQNTERPDKCAVSLLEGRVVILTDGTPFALIVPAVFAQFYQTPDDYSERPVMASLIRLVRIVALTFSLVFPSLYVSVIAFNPELIPTKFAVAVAGGRAGVPFPAVVEVLLMEVTMEVLREATLRVPQQVGGALSIVGVLVIGQAAVSAGFASPITVVVVALTTIGSFATPAYNAAVALRILRFLLTCLAGVFGLYGVMIGLILITHHMLSLRSFGVPYLSPIVPGDWQGTKDTWIRAPLWWMPKRPAHLQPANRRRVGDGTLRDVMQRPSHPLDPVHPRKGR